MSTILIDRRRALLYFSVTMNQCPRCQSRLESSAMRCPVCGAGLATLRALESLQDEINQTTALMREGLDRIDRKIILLRNESQAALAREQVSVPRQSVETALKSSPPPLPRVTPPPMPELPAAPVPIQKAAPVEPDSDSWNFSETQFGQKWLLIVGIAIMVLGIGYFLKYSFDRNWISPAMRVAMAYATGGIMLGLGEWFRRKLGNFGLYLSGGGIAALYFSTYAAYEIYDLLPPTLAFGLMILVTTLAGVLSLQYDCKWLAVLGLVGGFATPFVIDTHSNNYVMLFGYLTVLNAGLLAIAFAKQWRLLNYLGFFFTWAIFSAWMAWDYSDSVFWGVTFYMNLFYLIYAIAPFGVLLHGKTPVKLQGFGVTIPNSLLAFGYSYLMISGHADSKTVAVATLAYAGLHLALAQWLYFSNPENRRAMAICTGMALFFLAVTVPILASHEWITIFWACQACLTVWVATRTRSRWMLTGGMILGALTINRLLFFDYNTFDMDFNAYSFSGGYTDHLIARVSAAVATLGSVWLSGWFLKEDEKEAPGGINALNFWSNLHFIIFGLLLFLLLNIETSGFFHDYVPEAQFAAISVLWAVFSVGLISIGFLKKIESVRYTAIVLFAVTILKVLFSDMSNVSTPFRIISFIVLGLMLIGASYLYYRFRDRLFDGNDRTGKS